MDFKITNDAVNRGIEYIMRHLEDEISIDDVARHCNISKYHFSRVFRSQTGQSMYGFIKRLKMDQSALKLKIEKKKSITDIGLDYGYSSSNYSSAFKKHHAISPLEFRRLVNTSCVEHPFFEDVKASFLSFEEYDKEIRIEDLGDFPVIYERNIGNYIELGKKWCEFTEKYKEYLKEDTLLIERSYDDPSITDLDQCLYDICMTVEGNCPLENITTIEGGKFAVYRFSGSIPGIFTAFQGIFNVWLPDSGFQMDERYGLGIYRALDAEKMHVVMDLCIPVK